jgi:hypothetical protein
MKGRILAAPRYPNKPGHAWPKRSEREMSMNTPSLISIATLAILSVAGIAGAAQIKAAAPTARAATMSCTVPNNVSCKITSAKGLKSVLIKAGAAQDNVALVDKSYNGCPKQVTVTWDSAFQMGSKKIVECTSMGIKSN